MNLNTFKPGVHKLIHHHEHLNKMEHGITTAPIHVSVWPVINCQLNCPYCCFRNMPRDDTQLELNEFCLAVDVLHKYGLKALEFAGGGEPLLWDSFEQAVDYVYNKNLKISLVTNGILLDSISKEVLKKLSWIRVSLQSIKLSKMIAFDNIPENVKRSGSLIIYDNSKLKTLKDFHSFAQDNNIVIRVAPSKPTSIELEDKIKDAVETLGYPLIFFEKKKGASLGCYMAWLRAAIDWRGNFLPCPSIELALEYEAYIPDEFILCHISKLEEWLQKNPPHDLGYRCSYCNCGKEENDFIYELLQKVEDVDFV